MPELLLGCGSNREKILKVQDRPQDWPDLTTLDFNADHKPNVVWDLENLPYPFADEQFDEIHAYEVLEHTGTQGDWKFFFAQWAEFWRMLKPGGYFCGSCPLPTSVWAWADPSHKRIIAPETLTFLDQSEYTKQVGKTALSDFRFCYQGDFQRMGTKTAGETFFFVLRAVKPSRITAPQGAV